MAQRKGKRGFNRGPYSVPLATILYLLLPTEVAWAPISPSRFVYLCSRLFENPLIYAEFSYLGLLAVHRCFWWVGVLVGVFGHALRPTMVTTIGNSALAVLSRCYRYRHAERDEVDDHR